MARTVNMHDAKTHLSQLVAAVEDGEEIVIARKGVPVARLVSATPAKKTFAFGQHTHLVSLDILDDWEETDAQIRKMFADYLPDPE
jgi:prevent-host-death family protein